MPTFNQIIDKARNELPEEVRRAPWIGLDHGVVPLDTEQKLDQYLAAYGKMHVEKIRLALDSIANPAREFSGTTAIVDWGCGQALAACSLFDWMNERGLTLDKIGLVRLIEPSDLALRRAVANVDVYLGKGHALPINALIGDLSVEGLHVDADSKVTVHFFSNVLDIESIDLDALADLVKRGFRGRQIICCVGPLNMGSSRIQEFAEKFGVSEENVFASMTGRLAACRGTVSLLVFAIENECAKVLKAEFAPRFISNNVPVQDSMVLQRVLRNHVPAGTVDGKLVQFYRMVTDLEQVKEPSTRQTLPFPFEESGTGVLSVDFHNDEDFLRAYRANEFAQWPKDLLIGIDVLYGERAYRLLYCIVPHEDFDRLGVSERSVDIPLNAFAVSMGCSESLEMSNDQIGKLEDGIRNPELGWAGLVGLVEETVGNGATLSAQQVQVAFSDKNIALAQIYSELKTLTERCDVGSIPILREMLENAEFHNAVNMDSASDVEEDKLVQVVPMDENQRRAVAAILNNRVSVVTGPPGCGKTQLILNLMANALLCGKRVLVASKNNKAVDNVKDRFADFDPLGCCQRFGTKAQLADVTVPNIDRLLNLAQQTNENAVEERYRNNIGQYEELCRNLDEECKLLIHRDELKNRVSDDGTREEQLRIALDNVRQEAEAVVDGFVSNHLRENACGELDNHELEKLYAALQRLRNETAVRFSGFTGFFVRIFSRARVAADVLNAVADLPSAFSSFLDGYCGEKTISDFRSADDILGYCSSVVKGADSVRRYRTDLARLKSEQEQRLAKAESELAEFAGQARSRKHEFDELVDRRIEDRIEEFRNSISDLSLGRELVASSFEYNLVSGDSARGIAAYRAYLPNGIPWRREEIPAFVEATKRFLGSTRLTTITSLSVKSAFPLERELFDILVIDEASQCDVASALPLVLRAKQVVVIGDPKQLRHISRVDPEEEVAIKAHLGLGGAVHLKYAECSLWEYMRNWLVMADRNNVPLILDSHYRCHPEIIGYSNEMFYNDIALGGLRVCTRLPDNGLQRTGIFWKDVRGRQLSDTVNVNQVEIDEAIRIAGEYARRYQNLSIGLVTPFAAQAEGLNAKIPQELRGRIVADTVHKFQGDERDVMIYSLVVTDNSPESKIHWIDYRVPNLVNVAVTRAKSLLIVVGNRSYVRSHSRRNLPLGHLDAYLALKGK